MMKSTQVWMNLPYLSGADDHADREIHDVALDREFAEFLHDAHEGFSVRVSYFTS